MTGRDAEGADARAANGYDELYRSRADSGGPPWDIGAPQPALASALIARVKGPKVLDVGCGTGDLAIELARRGLDVTAVDVSRVAVEMARTKANRDGQKIDFRVQDVTALDVEMGPFGSVFDSGLLHSLSDSESAEYLARLPRVCAAGADVFVLAVSEEAGQGWGVTAASLSEAFSPPEWADTTVEHADVAAEIGGRRMSLPGFLLTTRRAT